MKIALDPYMHRHLPLTEIPRLAAELEPFAGVWEGRP